MPHSRSFGRISRGPLHFGAARANISSAWAVNCRRVGSVRARARVMARCLVSRLSRRARKTKKKEPSDSLTAHYWEIANEIGHRESIERNGRRRLIFQGMHHHRYYHTSFFFFFFFCFSSKFWLLFSSDGFRCFFVRLLKSLRSAHAYTMLNERDNNCDEQAIGRPVGRADRFPLDFPTRTFFLFNFFFAVVDFSLKKIDDHH